MTSKNVHSLILDTSPILTNNPSISTLLAKCEKLYTVPSIVDEVKDANARSRLEITVLPFLTIRSPKVNSVKLISDFARKTGDYAVLSIPDIQILALAYELECEQHGGGAGLRKIPGQSLPKRLPTKSNDDAMNRAVGINQSLTIEETASSRDDQLIVGERLLIPCTEVDAAQPSLGPTTIESDQISQEVESLRIADPSHTEKGQSEGIAPSTGQSPKVNPPTKDAESSDSEGWITPSNLRKQQEKDEKASTIPISEGQVMQVATITGDFAMQNVLLQIGLNLLSPSLQRVRNIRTYILRYMSKQFCPRCGKPTLTRVSCSTNSKGEFKLHLKKNMQWNHRGDRFSIPKPISGTASGKVGQAKGGGKGGWGQELILAEDQKEYLRATNGRKGKKETDLMDEDYLPSILTGDRGRVGGRPKVGAGRNVNSKKRS